MIWTVGISAAAIGFLLGAMLVGTLRVDREDKLEAQVQVLRWAEPTLEQYEDLWELAEDAITQYGDDYLRQKWRWDEELAEHRAVIDRIKQDD